MGSISLIANGRGQASVNYSVTANPSRGVSWTYAKLYIRPSSVANRESVMAATGGTFTAHGDPITILFNGDISIQWFADNQNCTHYAGTYKIFFVYNVLGIGSTFTYDLVDSGTVSVSGPVGSCDDDAGDDDTDGDTGDDDTGDDDTPGDSPEGPNEPTSNPCLPPQPSSPSPTLPTPCGGGGGTGGARGFS